MQTSLNREPIIRKKLQELINLAKQKDPGRMIPRDDAHSNQNGKPFVKKGKPVSEEEIKQFHQFLMKRISQLSELLNNPHAEQANINKNSSSSNASIEAPSATKPSGANMWSRVEASKEQFATTQLDGV